MKNTVLDTSILINHWRRKRQRPLERYRAADVRKWAKELIAFQDTDAIVTPVYLEMVAGVTNRHELDLTRAYLAEFQCIDERRILEEDWDDAIRRAQRVPASGRRRDLGDCLIRAIAERLNYDVQTSDLGFPS
jgi:predicted nucleic acid-binding protein